MDVEEVWAQINAMRRAAASCLDRSRLAEAKFDPITVIGELWATSQICLMAAEVARRATPSALPN